MNISRILLVSLFCLGSCAQVHSKNEIEEATARYDHWIQRLDADSISMMFSKGGSLGPTHGRDSIRKFLKSFKNITVISTKSISRSIIITGDSATQTGFYQQTDVVDKDTVHVKGRFSTRWRWSPATGWLIQAMVTNPS